MKLSALNILLPKFPLLVYLAVIVLIVGMEAKGSGAMETTLYDGYTCDKLMDVYKRAYISTGFTFKKQERLHTKDDGSSTALSELDLEFINRADPNTPTGYGRIKFYGQHADAGMRSEQVACQVWVEIMGTSDADMYWYRGGDELMCKMIAFDKMIWRASGKANAMVRKKLGRSVPDIPVDIDYSLYECKS